MVKVCDHRANELDRAHWKGQTAALRFGSAGQAGPDPLHDEPVAQIGPVQSKAGKLTEEWRRRRKGIRLNRTGQRKLSVSQLIQEGRK